MTESLVCRFLRQGLHVRVPVTGSSMAPSIRSGDIVVVAPVTAGLPAPGEVALYATGRRIIAHRLVAFDACRFILKGDAVPVADLPVEIERLLGKVIRVERAQESGMIGRARRIANVARVNSLRFLFYVILFFI